MSGYTVTTLAYVRTAAGVVKVPAGEPVPHDVLPSEVLRLVIADVVVDAPDAGDSTGNQAGGGDQAEAGDTSGDQTADGDEPEVSTTPKPRRPRKPQES
jgi:hypothetical protein